MYIAYNQFKSAMTQIVQVERVLPLPPAGLDDGKGAPAEAMPTGIDTIFEPSKDAVLDSILPMSIDVHVYRCLLESVASEMGARMTAMEAATKNAGELLARITLVYNRARQSIITTELMEITSGAEALKG